MSVGQRLVADLLGLGGMLLMVVPTIRSYVIARQLARYERLLVESRSETALSGAAEEFRTALARRGPVWPGWARLAFVAGLLLALLSRVIPLSGYFS
jgi:hypothetical protein